MEEIFEIQTEQGYVISTDKDKIDRDLVYQFLSVQSHWAINMPRSIFDRSIENSVAFGIYKDGEQLGFARVVTDYATFAYLADVFVIVSHRKQGLSKMLVKAVHQHPQLQNLRSWLLQTMDAHGLYAQFGWKLHDQPERLMRIKNNPAY